MHPGILPSDLAIPKAVAEVGAAQAPIGQVHRLQCKRFSLGVWPEAPKAPAVVGAAFVFGADGEALRIEPQNGTGTAYEKHKPRIGVDVECQLRPDGMQPLSFLGGHQDLVDLAATVA